MRTLNHIPERPSAAEAAQIMAIHKRRIIAAGNFRIRAQQARAAAEVRA